LKGEACAVGSSIEEQAVVAEEDKTKDKSKDKARNIAVVLLFRSLWIGYVH
jgi:hypothetical protein